MSNAKVVPLAEIAEIAAGHRARGETVVTTNGCFDLLHAGHILYLQAARAHGDVLVLGLNSDSSVSLLKGPFRPLVPQDQRALILAALECVDYVVVFDEPRPLRFLNQVKPDVHVKGGDYDAETLPETPTVRGYGGRVVTIPLVPGLSTTALVARVRQQDGEAHLQPAGDRRPSMFGAYTRQLVIRYLQAQRTDLELFVEFAIAQEGLPDSLAKVRRLVWSALQYVAEHGTPTPEKVAEYLKEQTPE